MKKTFASIIVVIIVIAGLWYFARPKPSVNEPKPTANNFVSSAYGFSINIPEGYKADETYAYQASPEKVIAGVKFTIPAALSEGTNLSNDSYLSVEHIPQTQSCTADKFFDGVHMPVAVTDSGKTYSVATSSGAGAGNRYEETVYAISGTNPCVAVRYLIHYGAIQNYPEGAVREFDEKAVLAQFDVIRKTLVVK